jgi:hypothetical protein
MLHNQGKGSDAMKINQKELNHLVFLSEVILEGKKKSLMEEAMQCLLYIVKSVEEVDVPQSVVDQMQDLIVKMEEDLRSENERMSEIQGHLRHHRP